jgi:hypothetical protein
VGRESMLNRLRTLFGKGAKSPSREIAFEDLPAHIEKQENSIREYLDREVAARRPHIVTAIDSLKDILDSFSDVERTPSSHPKLEKIAQSSLPHFVRSFQQHINRPLPPEPEAFYHEVGVLLKGCITAMKGAGKYLPAVFPEEMKELRHHIGIIGRTMNELTALFSQAKKERERLATIRGRWDAIRSLLAEQEERRALIGTLHARSHALQEEREQVMRSLEELRRSDAYGILMDQQDQLAYREKEVRDLKLQKEQTLGAVLSVYRRAARIARHQNNREREKMMEESIALLESSPRNCEQIRENLGRTLTVITELIQTGTLSLKGQDEQRIVSSPEATSGEVFRACREMQSAGDLLETERRRIHETPVQANLLNLESEQGRIAHACEKILQEQQEQDAVLRTLPERIQTLTEELGQEVPEVFGEECSVMFATLKQSGD